MRAAARAALSAAPQRGATPGAALAEAAGGDGGSSGAGPVAPWVPLGRALQRHLDAPAAAASGPEAEPLLFWSNLHPRQPQPLPSGLFFRPPAEMPPLERT